VYMWLKVAMRSGLVAFPFFHMLLRFAKVAKKEGKTRPFIMELRRDLVFPTVEKKLCKFIRFFLGSRSSSSGIRSVTKSEFVNILLVDGRKVAFNSA